MWLNEILKCNNISMAKRAGVINVITLFQPNLIITINRRHQGSRPHISNIVGIVEKRFHMTDATYVAKQHSSTRHLPAYLSWLLYQESNNIQKALLEEQMDFD